MNTNSKFELPYNFDLNNFIKEYRITNNAFSSIGFNIDSVIDFIYQLFTNIQEIHAKNLVYNY